MGKAVKLLPWFVATVAVAFALFRAEPARVQAQDAGDRPGPDLVKMLEKTREYNTPGEQHEELAKRVGTWDFEHTMHMPGMPPTTSKGTSVHTMDLDGRWLRDDTTSSIMGQPYKGLGFTGYDMAIEKHIFVWLDNMGTGMIAGVGDWDEETKTVTYQTHSSDPVTGKTKFGRTMIQWISDDAHVMKTYSLDPEGNERLEMEIAYTRRPGTTSKPTSRGR